MLDQNLPQENDINTDELQSELELAQKKAEEYLNGWKRAKADYLNFKRETEDRSGELIQFANAALIARLLPIFDHFKLACQHVPLDFEKADWVVGFLHIKKQFEDFLKNLGIEGIKTVGEKFNPEFHEAVVHKEKAGFEPDIVYEEVKSGYTLHDKVIYAAKVKVAK